MVAIVYAEQRQADRRLRQYFNSTPNQWVKVVQAAVSARARCNENDAKAAPGFYAWTAATARSRVIFGREGWERGEHNGIETIFNSDLRMMIAVMNTDAGTCNLTRSPRNRTYKGTAAKGVVDLNNQGELFRRDEVAPLKVRPYALWYLCIHDDGGKVLAELSKPSEYKGGYVVDYSERIFILRDGEWEKIIVDTSVDDGDQDFAIDVVRL